MGLSNELISQFAKITNDKKTSRIDEVTLYGEVVECDDSVCVRFDGSEQLTPVTTITEKDEEGNITNFKYGAASVKTGDRVSVSLKNHSATITGNLSDPPMGRAEIITTEDSIIAKVDDKVKLQIDALGVKIDGLTEFTNGLENGTTSIDGACIKTGTIDAERLNLTGSITFGDLDSNAQQKITDAETAANNASTAAGNAQATADTANANASSAQLSAQADQTLVSGWAYSGSTYIDGSKIMTGTVQASTLQGGQIQLLDSQGLGAAYFGLTGASSYANGTKLVIYSGAIELNSAFGDMYLTSGSGASITLSSSGVASHGNLIPGATNRYSLGSYGFLWSDLYCQNGTIQTSDKTVKKDISTDLTQYDEFFNRLSPCSFKFIDGESGRTHLGMISQEVEKALDASSISDMDFAGFIKSPKTDKDGNVIDGEYSYALRYTEFIPLLIWQVQKLKARIAELEEANG